jgi:nicotinate-nucleotide pyrophosphorylase (carboxylating)
MSNLPTAAYLSEEVLARFIASALAEDVGDGDHSSRAAIPAEARNRARLLVKGTGVLAGVEVARRVLATVDTDLTLDVLMPDGSRVQPGDIAFTVEGRAQSILTAERLLLNCMQRMSGIATLTRHLTDMIAGTGTRLLDTRKTTPNFRVLEKWAVLIGGGHNHRFGLFDMVMLKDNHVDYAGGVRQAIEATHAYLKATGREQLRIEVETRNLSEVEEALATGGIHRIMFDNYPLDLLRQGVALVAGRVETEASGGITEATIRDIAETGVDFISVGALTHSAGSMDLSLKAF